MSAPVRIGTCSFADEALVGHWYPKGLPARDRLGWYAEHFSTVEIDSTFYSIPARSTVEGWAERTPDDFVIHIKAFGVLTRHPVRLEQLPASFKSGHPKVSNLDVLFSIKEQVLWLEVAMADVEAMAVVETRDNLLEVVQRFVGVQPTARDEIVEQLAAFGVLHDEVAEGASESACCSM